MRLLHTSDWHLGRSLHGTDLLAEQEAVLGGLAAVVAEQRVDVVLVAGDVYDRAVPSADATAVLDRVLTRLCRSGAEVVLTPGNHDSARRLGFGAGLFSVSGVRPGLCRSGAGVVRPPGTPASARRLGFGAGLFSVSGVHLRVASDRVDEPVILADEHGDVAIYGIPYLEPEVARHELGLGGRGDGSAATARGHEAVLAAAMERVRADLFLRPGARSVVLAHAFVGGAQPSESERDICVGGVDRVPEATFDGVDYVALGHLHRPQTLTQRMRYSGSPLPYSFAEAGHGKQAWIVDLDARGLSGVRPVPLPLPRPLTLLTGELAALLADPAHAAAEG